MSVYSSGTDWYPQDAAQEIFRRYVNRLVGLARSQLPAGLRRRIDPEDVVQSVFGSFFGAGVDEFHAAPTGGLWALLATVTARKVANAVRRHEAGCRSYRREQPPPDDDLLPTEDQGARASPLDGILLQETLAEVLAPLTERQRSIVLLSLEGFSRAEIHEQLGYSDSTISRVLSDVREALERLSRES